MSEKKLPSRAKFRRRKKDELHHASKLSKNGKFYGKRYQGTEFVVSEMDQWNPMAEAYDSRYFNSYPDGATGNLMQRQAGNEYLHHSDIQPITLYVCNVPLDFTKEACRNIFLKYGNVLRINILPLRKDRDKGQAGQQGRSTGHLLPPWFVEMASLHEAQLAIRALDGQPPLMLRVSVANNSKPYLASSHPRGGNPGPGLFPNPHALSLLDSPPGHAMPSLLETPPDLFAPPVPRFRRNREGLEDETYPSRDLTLVVHVRTGGSNENHERVVKVVEAPRPTPLGQRPEFNQYEPSEDMRLSYTSTPRPLADSYRESAHTRGGNARGRGGRLGGNFSDGSHPTIDGAGDRGGWQHSDGMDHRNEDRNYSVGRGTRIVHGGAYMENQEKDPHFPPTRLNTSSKASSKESVGHEKVQGVPQSHKKPSKGLSNDSKHDTDQHTPPGQQCISSKGPVHREPSMAPSGIESRSKEPARKPTSHKMEQSKKPEIKQTANNVSANGRMNNQHTYTKEPVIESSKCAEVKGPAALPGGAVNPQKKGAPLANGPLATAVSQRTIKAVQLPVNKTIKVEVSHCVSPDQFWVQSAKYSDMLQNMMINLQGKVTASHKPVAAPRPGLVCAAKYAEDDIWYRCCIEKVSATGSCTIFYLDFGNTEEAAIETLSHLPEEFFSLESQAVKCSKADCGNYTAEEAAKFCEYARNRSFSATVIQRCGDVDIVTLSEKENGGGDKDKVSNVKEEPLPPPSVPQEAVVEMPVPNAVDDTTLPVTQTSHNLLSSVISQFEIGDEVMLMISTVENHLRFWCLPMHDRIQEMLQIVLHDFNSVCEDLESQKPHCPADTKVLAAKSVNDEQWYRAYRKNIELDGSCNVFYIDYGNGENVRSVMPLVDNHQTIPGFALLSVVNTTPPLSANVVEYLKTNVCVDNSLKFIVIKKESDSLVGRIVNKNNELVAEAKLLPWTAEITVESQTSANTSSAQSGTATASPASDIPSTMQSPSCMQRFMADHLPAAPKLKANETLEVLLCVLVSLNEVYIVHDMQSAGEVTSLLLDVANGDSCDLTGYQPLTKEVVCAKYNKDGVWYRAEVLENTKNFTTVRFIDFGNVEQVSYTDIKMLPSSLQSCYPLATRVSILAGNEPESLRILGDYVDAFLPMKVINVDVMYPVVQFLNSGALTPVLQEVCVLRSPIATSHPPSFSQPSVAPGAVNSPQSLPVAAASEMLQTSPSVQMCTSSLPNHSGRLYFKDCLTEEFPLHQTIDVVISSVMSPDLIFCQLAAAENLQKMNDLTVLINNYCKNLPPSSYKPENLELCLAKWAEDGEWYRAYCLRDNGDSCDLIFVDYGNVANVPSGDIRRMSQHLMEVNCQAVHCRLAEMCETTSWSPELIERLKGLLKDLAQITVVAKEEECVYSVEFPQFTEELINIGIPFLPATPVEDDEDEELRRLLAEEAALAAKKAEIEARKQRLKKK